MNFCDQLPCIPKETFLLRLTETKSSLVPSVSEKNRKFSPCFHLLCHIIGLVLDPLIIIVAVWSQIFLSDFFWFSDLIRGKICLVQSQTTDIESCPLDLFFRRNQLGKDWMSSFFPTTGNPLSGPCFVLLCSLKNLYIRSYYFSLICRHDNFPVISRIRCCLKIHFCSTAVKFCFLCIKEDF